MHDLEGLLPTGADRRWVETSAGRLSVLHAGRPRGRTPVLLVHGGGGDAAAISWYRLFDPLSADAEVWAPDLPGFGASLDVDPVGGPDALAGVLVEVMDALGVRRAVVVGVSLGGDAALHLALRDPDRVAGLVLVAPGGLRSGTGSRWVQRAAWLAAKLPDVLLLSLARTAGRFVEQALAVVVRDPHRLPPEVVQEFARIARHPRGALGHLRYNQATLGWSGLRNDLAGQVPAIRAPTLFFHGDHDLVAPLSGSQRAVASMPGARLVVAPGSGHWAHLESHDLFLATVRGFLGEVAVH